MAAWTYSDWITLGRTRAAYDRLCLHMQEVSDKIDVAKGGEGFYKSTTDMVQYLANLERDREKLAKDLGIGGGAGAAGVVGVSRLIPYRRVR